MDAIVESVLAEAPSFDKFKIRVDKGTQKASVIDVIRMITGKKSRHAGQTLNKLPQKVQKIVQLRINGNGRPTPCVDAIKSFRRQSAHYNTHKKVYPKSKSDYVVF